MKGVFFVPCVLHFMFSHPCRCGKHSALQNPYIMYTHMYLHAVSGTRYLLKSVTYARAYIRFTVNKGLPTRLLLVTDPFPYPFHSSPISSSRPSWAERHLHHHHIIVIHSISRTPMTMVSELTSQAQARLMQSVWGKSSHSG